MSWQNEALVLSQSGMSGRKIGKQLGVSKTQVNAYLKRVREKEEQEKTSSVEIVNTVQPLTEAQRKALMDMLLNSPDGIPVAKGIQREVYGTRVEDIPERYLNREDNSRILFISDMHVPYHHPKTLGFLSGLKAKYNPTRIICVGDECDQHSLSFHDSDPDLWSAGDELKKTQEFMKELESLFPVMDLVDSNHGSLLYRRGKAHGIPRYMLKDYNDVLGVGKGWKWHNDLTIKLPNGQPLYICHGKSSKGITLSQNMAMNVVQGHFHSEFNIAYWSNPNNLFWSMQVGCMVDDKSLAMAYNKLTLKRPIIGTGVVIDSKPILETMELSRCIYNEV